MYYGYILWLDKSTHQLFINTVLVTIGHTQSSLTHFESLAHSEFLADFFIFLILQYKGLIFKGVGQDFWNPREILIKKN